MTCLCSCVTQSSYNTGSIRDFNKQDQIVRDWRTLLIQYLLQKKRSLTAEEKIFVEANDCKKCGGKPLLTDLAVMMRIDTLALFFGMGR